MNKKIILGTALCSSVLAFGGMKATFAASLENCKMSVTATRNFELYTNSSLKHSSKKNIGSVYQVDGYRKINGVKYYRVYRSGEYQGYISERDVKPLVSKSEAKKVTVKAKTSYNLWRNFYFNERKGQTERGKVYNVKRSYVLGNGVKYYSLYRTEKDGKEAWYGYVNANAVRDLTSKKEDRMVTVKAKASYSLWKNFFFNVKKGQTTQGQVYKAKYSYTLGNGAKYYSLYQTDKKGKELWKGYVNANSSRDFTSKASNMKVQVNKDATRWRNFYWTAKKGRTADLGKQVLTVKRIYTLGNGSEYYSIYNSKDEWQGYTYASAFKKAVTPSKPTTVVKPSTPAYFTDKDIADGQAKIVVRASNPVTNIYGPNDKRLSGKVIGKTSDKTFKNKVVTYKRETFNQKGDYVQIFKGSKCLGWIDRQSLSDVKTTAKLADTSKNYGVYQNVNGGKRATMDDFEKGHLEVDQHCLDKKGKPYYHVIANGGAIGWVNANFVKRNYISVPNNISLVHSYNGNINWEARHAIMGATDENGTLLDPITSSKVSVSQETVPTNIAGTTAVTYKAGKGSKTVNVTVRSDAKEGVAKVLAHPEHMAEGKSGIKTGKPSQYTSSPNYSAGVETKANQMSGGIPTYRFSTKFFAPIWLSMSRDKNGATESLPTYSPQGLAVMGNTAYLTCMNDAQHETGTIIGYDMNHIGRLGDLRQLSQLAEKDFNQFKAICRGITVSPRLFIGHGQALSTDGRSLYLTPSKKVSDLNDFNQIMEINPSTFEANYANTFRITAYFGGSSYTHRNSFNIAVKDANTFYTMVDVGWDDRTKPAMEIWEVKKVGNAYQTARVLTTTTRMGAASGKTRVSPQGLAYNRAQNAVYYAGDCKFLGFQLPSSAYPYGRLIASVDLHAQRETEGIAFSQDGKTMYMGLNCGSEVLSAPVPSAVNTVKQ